MLAFAKATRNVQAQRCRSCELGDELVLHRLPRPSTVEIDDVRPFSARFSELAQRVRGRGRIMRDLIEAALLEPHHAPADQVHCGIDDHPRNAARKRAPASAERSGWNCTPSQLRCRTTAGISRP